MISGDLCVHRTQNGKDICNCLSPLKVKQCDGEKCKFFQTEKQKAESDRKSRERLESLPEEEQQVIRDRHYHGKNLGNKKEKCNMAREWCERWDCDLEGIYEWMLEQCNRDEFNCIDCPYFVEKEIDSLDDLL